MTGERCEARGGGIVCSGLRVSSIREAIKVSRTTSAKANPTAQSVSVDQLAAMSDEQRGSGHRSSDAHGLSARAGQGRPADRRRARRCDVHHTGAVRKSEAILRVVCQPGPKQ
jgi:hypothetical protein